MNPDPVVSGTFSPNPELFVSYPDPDKNEKTDKLSKLYFFFALMVQKIQWKCSFKSDSCWLILNFNLLKWYVLNNCGWIRNS